MLAMFLAVGDRGLPLRLESEMLDLRFRSRPARPHRVPVVIVEIDDASIAEIGRWPWSRQILARLLDRIAAVRPKVIGFDLLFAEPEPLKAEVGEIEAAMAPLLQSLDPANKRRLGEILSGFLRSSDADASLDEAIRRDGKVILPFTLDLLPKARNSTASLPADLARTSYDRVRGSGPDNLPMAVAVHMPGEALARNARLAHVTTVPDGTGSYRYDYPVLRYADAYLPSRSLEAVRVFLGVAKNQVVVELGQGIDVGALQGANRSRDAAAGELHPPGTFQRVSFADALLGRVAPQIFSGKMVLIGAIAKGLGDAIATPFEPAMSGVERHATLIANLLDQDFLRRDGEAVAIDAFLILLGGLVVGVLAR
jgi:CHASE2 domain-containing sensor protein